tara:strand:+ start:1720 stop:2124 length:405 start_codon:yes stop_codon:yes gene_type:complete
MKTWIKYLLSILALVITINFWLTYQDFPNQIYWIVLVIIPTIISIFFSYRLLKFKQRLLKFGLSVLIATTVTFISFNFREIIISLINYLTTDNETELFFFYILYFLQVILLTWFVKLIDFEKLKEKIKTLANNS